MSIKTRERKGISRRDFVKGAAAGGVAAALGGIIPAVASAQTAPKWDEEADVVVVGTGCAGYAAAIEAKDGGAASVILIEKEKWYGGNSLLSGGNMEMPNNHIAKALGFEDKDGASAYEDYFALGERRNSPELLKLFVQNAADTVLWLEKLGVVWNKTANTPEYNRIPNAVTPNSKLEYEKVGASRGITHINVLHKAAGARNIPVRLGYRLTKILRPDPKGPVVGIEAVVDGKTVNIRAKKAVILATGGFKSNHQLCRSVYPQYDEEFTWSGAPYTNTTGDGLLAAVAIGAGTVDMSYLMGAAVKLGSTRYVVWDPPGKYTPDITIASGGLPFTVGGTGQKYIVIVDNDGNRYMDESKFAMSAMPPWHPFMEAFYNLPKRPRNTWVIVDSAGAQALNWTLQTFQAADPNKAPYLDPKWVATADTLDQLAAKMGVPAANLAATIKKYNGYVTGGMGRFGEDKDFGRPIPFYAIAKPPFFAARIALIGHDQPCGLRVNTKMQVIDATLPAETGAGPSVALDQERVIPHLYAAGEVTGGTFGAERGHGKLGAYTVQGRFAGKNAAKETALV